MPRVPSRAPCSAVPTTIVSVIAGAATVFGASPRRRSRFPRQEGNSGSRAADFLHRPSARHRPPARCRIGRSTSRRPDKPVSAQSLPTIEARLHYACSRTEVRRSLLGFVHPIVVDPIKASVTIGVDHHNILLPECGRKTPALQIRGPKLQRRHELAVALELRARDLAGLAAVSAAKPTRPKLPRERPVDRRARYTIAAMIRFRAMTRLCCRWPPRPTRPQRASRGLPRSPARPRTSPLRQIAEHGVLVDIDSRTWDESTTLAVAHCDVDPVHAPCPATRLKGRGATVAPRPSLHARPSARFEERVRRAPRGAGVGGFFLRGKEGGCPGHPFGGAGAVGGGEARVRARGGDRGVSRYARTGPSGRRWPRANERGSGRRSPCSTGRRSARARGADRPGVVRRRLGGARHAEVLFGVQFRRGLMAWTGGDGDPDYRS